MQEKEITYPIMESVLVIFQYSMMKDDDLEDNLKQFIEAAKQIKDHGAARLM